MAADHAQVKKLADNVYEIQFGKKKSAPARATAETPAKPAARKSSRVIKAGDLHAGDVRADQIASPQVRTYVPGVLGSLEMGQAEIAERPAHTLESLRNNLHSLSQLQLKLRFMLKELEEY